MMNRTLICTAALLVGTSAAMADPFEPAVVPADAKWVLHVDVDAAAKSPLWQMVDDRIAANPEGEAKLREMEMFTGMVFPQDLHSVTVYGLGFGDADGVILIKANSNQQQLLGFMQMNPNYASFTHGDHEIISWEDKGKIMYGSFYSADRIIMAQSRENVAKGIDTLAGKAASIKPDSIMAQPTGTGVLAGVASDAIGFLAEKDRNNPVLKNVKSAWITLSQKDQDDIALQGQFDCGTPQVAQQMKSMAEGLKAAGMMFASQENADPKVKMIAPLLPGLQITQQDKNVMLIWAAPFEQVKSLVEQARAARGR